MARPFTSAIGLGGSVVGNSTTAPMGLRNGDRLMAGATAFAAPDDGAGNGGFAPGASGETRPLCTGRPGDGPVGSGDDFLRSAGFVAASAETTPSLFFSASCTSGAKASGRLGGQGGAMPMRLAAAGARRFFAQVSASSLAHCSRWPCGNSP